MTISRGAVFALLFCASPAVAGDVTAQASEADPYSAADRVRVDRVTAPTRDFSTPEPFEARSAGAATVMGAVDRRAFLHPSATLDADGALDFSVGQSLFEKLWVAAPSATTASDGLGPLYNARACSNCHPANGRGHPPETADDDRLSMVLRISVPDDVSDLDRSTLEHLPNAPEPTYGFQVQDRGLPGMAVEGRFEVTYTPVPVTLGDGTLVTLRKPHYAFDAGGYGPVHPAAEISPRVAPQMIGLGLIEAIPAAALLAHADPEDADGDGISGRANRVWDAERGSWTVGRFGHKAGEPTVRSQAMAALNTDIGLSNPLKPSAAGDCTARQPACLAAPDGNTPAQDDLEAGGIVMDLLTHFTANIAVPARRDVGAASVLRGKELFYASGCASCHVPKYVKGRDGVAPEHGFQLIWPYSDFLLHDMGEGLADDRPEWLASGREWRTPPLWGIGLTETVSGHRYLLHDGRARGYLEAVLWHGGEAEASREIVRRMPKPDRDALVSFLESL